MRAISTFVTFCALFVTGADAQPILTVRVYNQAGLSDNTLLKAEFVALGAFRRAGIEAEWLHCPSRGAEEDRYPDCKRPTRTGDVMLHIAPRPLVNSGLPAEAFGVALQATGDEPATHAYVFLDRAERAVADSGRRSEPVSLSALLGCIIAHEIGHLVLGQGSHSARGIMRARWQPTDLQEMEIGLLGFTTEQAKSLRAKAELRSGAAAN